MSATVVAAAVHSRGLGRRRATRRVELGPPIAGPAPGPRLADLHTPRHGSKMARSFSDRPAAEP